MTANTISVTDPHSNLIWTFDAVHGSVDIRDASPEYSGLIAMILNSPIMQRLRRIKQLGFAYQSYPSADHSRYAHAMGTMHMMRAILNRIEVTRGFSQQLYKDLAKAFPSNFKGKRNLDHENLIQHMLVAALLQDIGELPFSQSTKHAYKPSTELIDFVENKIGFKLENWRDKSIFTLACLYSNEMYRLLKNLSIPFVTFLIIGKLNSNQPIPDTLLEIRQMIDGVIDADRLDYVFRDAHHTVGGLGSSKSVVESLLYYDNKGPVFFDPGPVSNFLATRAYLYSNVYYAPANRFRLLLLVQLLKGLKSKEECAVEFFGNGYKKGVSLEDFMELDDVFLFSRITNFSLGKNKRRLDQQSKIALDILTGNDLEYRCFWLPPQIPTKRPERDVTFPSELFFDTFTDQFRSLYKPGTIRVESNIFSQIGTPIPLEECGGPFSAMFKPGWSISPMPDSIMVFMPKDTSGESWNLVDDGLKNGWLYEQLLLADPFGPVDFPTDTRNIKGFTGGTIFISFAWADVKYAKRLAKSLFDRKRRYFLLAGTYQGIGKTPAENSMLGVEEADAVVIIASLNYCLRFTEAPDGNIAKEVFSMSRRIFRDPQFKIIPLAIDNFSDLKNALPWSQLGFKEMPFVGRPLKEVSQDQFEEAVTELIKAL